MARDATLIKHREIRFCALNEDPRQAETAAVLLKEMEGIVSLQGTSPTLLHVSYDLSTVTLQGIEEALVELNFHLDNTLLSKLKRALYYYTEENERLNRGFAPGCKDCVQLFVNRYQRLPHGCRDERPGHWRSYL